MWKKFFRTSIFYLVCFLITGCGPKRVADATPYSPPTVPANHITLEKFLASNSTLGEDDRLVDQSSNLLAGKTVHFRIEIRTCYASKIKLRIEIPGQSRNLFWNEVELSALQTASFFTLPSHNLTLSSGHTAKVIAIVNGREMVLGTYYLTVKDEGAERYSFPKRPKAEAEVFKLGTALDKNTMEPTNLGVSFPAGSSLFFFAKISFANATYEKVQIIIRQKGRIMSLLDWRGQTVDPVEAVTRTYTGIEDECKHLKPGKYVAELVVKVSPYGNEMILSHVDFTLTKATPPSATENQPTLSAKDQLAKISDLKKLLSEKIKEAVTQRDYFGGQEKAIKEQLSKSEGLTEKRVARLKRDLARKQSYYNLINTYCNQLTTRLDTLEEIEDDFHDRSRWRNLIDESFVKKVNQAITEVTALLNDTPLTKTTNKSKQKGRKKK